MKKSKCKKIAINFFIDEDMFQMMNKNILIRAVYKKNNLSETRSEYFRNLILEDLTRNINKRQIITGFCEDIL